ncbi:centrosomal protein of 97 kDa [Myxocyprinus asiaticus]|uniref:centrosomal protein of 97 kDa n=1 Tax=Myxocyprinus asiaticus TaxID=70543 RepID=UPI002222BE9F|nr:centrosomal protein of 97 kDa [Myxocyprinus asiaticus]
MAATDRDPIKLITSNQQSAGVLDLSHQSLHKLDPKFLCPVTHTLILDQNHIIKLEHLEQIEALQQLSVACNRLVRMMGVSKLTHLRVLNLPNNSIGYIEGLKDLNQLEWLNLSGNNIKVIEQLNNCVSLQHLDLSDNNISHSGDLTKLSALKTLLLHGNNITTLRTVPAHLPPNLSILSLAENEIRDLTEVSYLAPLHSLEQLSIMSNPCVMATPSLPGCDYRPYVVSWILNLKVLDGYVVSQKESLKAEWLYSQGKGRMFRPGQHAQLVQYLASTCPLTATTALQSAEDAKLERILNKQRQHQRQLQQRRHSSSTSPSRPTHLDVKQPCVQKNRDEAAVHVSDDVIAHPDVEPVVQVNTWMAVASSPVITVARPPSTTAEGMIVEEVQTDEEKLHGALLSSQSAFLPFNPPVDSTSAPDSGEEEFDDSLAPPTSAQLCPSEQDSVQVGGALTCQTHGSDHSHQLSDTESFLCSDINMQQRVLNSEVVFQNGTQEDIERSVMQNATTAPRKVHQCEAHDAALRIQSWWRGHWTRHTNPHAKEVRAEIRLRRMQDHIVHLTTEIERMRKQQEEERLQRRVQEEAVKFLWKQFQVMLDWQSSVMEQLGVGQRSAVDLAAAPVCTEISIPESGFHSPGERQVALESRLSSSAAAGSPLILRSLGAMTPAAEDGDDVILLQQYLSSVQRQEEEEKESCDMTDVSHDVSVLVASPEDLHQQEADSHHALMDV